MMDAFDRVMSIQASLFAGDVSVDFNVSDLTEIYWALQAKHARLNRERPERPELAEHVRDVQRRLHTVYTEVLRLQRLAITPKDKQ